MKYKTKKIFGIGTIFFLVAILTSSATAVPITQNEAVESEKEEELNQLISIYRDDLEDINQYLENYIQNNKKGLEKINEIKDILPYDLYIKYENFENQYREITKRGNLLTKSGGKTDFNINWITIGFLIWKQTIGYRAYFWICHQDMVWLQVMNAAGLFIVGLLLILTGVGAPAGIAFCIVGLLDALGFISLNEIDQGNGIKGSIFDLYIDPFPAVLTYLGPQ